MPIPREDVGTFCFERLEKPNRSRVAQKYASTWADVRLWVAGGKAQSQHIRSFTSKRTCMNSSGMSASWHEPSSTESGEFQRFKFRSSFIGTLSEDGHHGTVGKLGKAVERRDAIVTDPRVAIGQSSPLHLANHETESRIRSSSRVVP